VDDQSRQTDSRRWTRMQFVVQGAALEIVKGQKFSHGAKWNVTPQLCRELEALPVKTLTPCEHNSVFVLHAS